MICYIQLENGVPIGHPIALDNLKLVYPTINFENDLLENFAKVVRTSIPQHTVYERILQEPEYTLVDGTVYANWKVEKLSKAEIKNLQTTVKQNWKQFPNWQSWSFNNLECRYDPPIPYPTDGNAYEWDETIVSWVLPNPDALITHSSTDLIGVEDNIIPNEPVIDETVDPTVE